jgi:uncharacterized membrane protein
MKTIDKGIEIDVPVRTAYNQWTQFEEFPQFMEGVESVTQIDDTHLRWRAEIAGVRREWEAEITEQTPDQRIAWTTREGTENSGVVTFHRLDDGRTRVMVQLTVADDGIVEKLGGKLGIIEARVAGDLQRFKEMMEAREKETGGWRGEVSRPAG